MKLLIICWALIALVSSTFSVNRLSELEKNNTELQDRITKLEDSLAKVKSMVDDDKSKERTRHVITKRELTADGNSDEPHNSFIELHIGNLYRGQAGVAGASGTVYSRWGRNSCGNDSSVLYTGFAGGSNCHQPGGFVNIQCMPLDPEHNKFSNGRQRFYGSYMAGVEYQSGYTGVFSHDTQDENMPCARCYTNNRPALMMIPAKRTCPDNWTKEYEGYLMAEYYNRNHQTTIECVDANPEFVNGEGADNDGGTLHFVRPQCDKGGHCPPYHSNKEITCVVCSK